MKKLQFYVLQLLLTVALVTSVSAHAKASSADRKFKRIMQAHWEAKIERDPTFATSLGVRKYDDKLADLSLEALAASTQQAANFVTQLNKVNTSRLSKENQLNHALLKLELETAVAESQFGGKYLLLTNRGGPHLELTGLPQLLPFFTAADYQSYVQRLAAMPRYLAQASDRLRAGLQAGWSQPCKPMQGFEQSIEVHLVEDIQSSNFMQPFATKPTTLAQPDFDSMRAQASELVANKVIPALAEFNQFYQQEYAPACRTEVGTSSMSGGKDYYQHLVKKFTTTNRSADEIHQLGLSEVARIKAEMLTVMQQANFKGDFQAWLEHLKTTPEYYPKTAAQRMQAVAEISKKIDGELPKLFGKLPRMPYGLKEIPLDIAEKTTTAYYQPPAGDGSRAGFYYVNTTLLDTRPLYQLEALSLHEAVPGHHLQIALSQELDLPNFRKYARQTVFVEGWGLYAERLGLEVGFYQTPYTNFGRLSYEMWRACRLVVDTGIHSKGWTRQQAIDYMAEHSGLSMNNITSEVDRYITWPGQALAYKIGELKLRELRSKAELALGEKFDVRDFHDRVLENGALPLSILEGIIDQWLASQTRGQ